MNTRSALVDYPIYFFRKGIVGFEEGKSHFVDLNKCRVSGNKRRAFVSLFLYCSNPLNPYGMDMGLFINHFRMGIKTIIKQPS